MKQNKSTARALSEGILLILLLSVCLALTTAALVYSMISVDSNMFSTGTVDIDLNGSEPIIDESEYLFEPGMTVKEDFYVKNIGSADIYYRLYFKNLQGDLSDTLEVRICDGERVLYEGTPSTLTEGGIATAGMLSAGERRELQIYFHLPNATGNEAQRLRLKFDFAAEATQVKNNEGKSFG